MPENNTKTELSQMPRIGRGGAGQMNSRVNVQKPKHMKQTIGRLLQYIGKSKFILFGLIAMMLLITGGYHFLFGWTSGGRFGTNAGVSGDHAVYFCPQCRYDVYTGGFVCKVVQTDRICDAKGFV